MLAGRRFSAYVEPVSRLIDSRTRWFGVLFLLLALGMVVWGQTWLQPHLRGAGFVTYWMVCLGCTLLALFTALADARATRRRLRQMQADLLREALGGRLPPKGEDGEEPPEPSEGQRPQRD